MLLKSIDLKKSVLHDLHLAQFDGSLVSADFQANLCLL